MELTLEFAEFYIKSMPSHKECYRLNADPYFGDAGYIISEAARRAFLVKKVGELFCKMKDVDVDDGMNKDEKKRKRRKLSREIKQQVYQANIIVLGTGSFLPKNTNPMRTKLLPNTMEFVSTKDNKCPLFNAVTTYLLH
jgi:hypothetical protein